MLQQYKQHFMNAPAIKATLNECSSKIVIRDKCINELSQYVDQIQEKQQLEDNVCRDTEKRNNI